MRKPRNPKEFEQMVRDCAEMKYQQAFSLLGRNGETQYGGDVHSQDWSIIIQCKCYDDNNGANAYSRLRSQIIGSISRAGVVTKKGDYSDACDFYDEMQRFVIATTLDCDLKTQKAIHKIERDVPIEFLFWDELVELYEKFEKKYKLKELRQVLDTALFRERDNHPSFKLLQPDDIDLRLFPTYQEQELEICAVENGIENPVWQRVQRTWEEGNNRSIVIEGEGGIGKTVTLFSITQTKSHYLPPPAIYIPMFRLVDEAGICKTISEYIESKYPSLFLPLDSATIRTWDDGPRLLILLDGFNEVPSNKRRIVLRQINDWRANHPGAQIIAVSRPMDNIDLSRELAGDPISLRLRALDMKTACDFITEHGLQLPSPGPIWDILTIPLFLILYVKTGYLPLETPSGYPIDARKAINGGKLIWNYLQRELLRDNREDLESWAIQCSVACEYIIPRIAYEMAQNNTFSISGSNLYALIQCAVQSIQFDTLPHHLKEIFSTYEDHHPGEYPDLTKYNWNEVIILGLDLLHELKENQPQKKGRTKKTFTFIHQIFRDCLAGIYLVNEAEAISDCAVPEPWKYWQRHLVLNYTSELIEADDLNQIWTANRLSQQHSRKECIVDHITTCNLLEVVKRTNRLSLDLDFSGMDLRGASLFRYLEKNSIGFSLFNNAKLSMETILDRAVFESEGHTSSINCLGILPSGGIISGSDDKSIRLWEPTSGQCVRKWENDANRITCIAVHANSSIISGSDDNTVRLWNPDSPYCQKIMSGHSNWVTCVSFITDRQIVSGSEDNTLRIWDVITGECVRILEGHTNWITCISIMQNGNIVSGSNDNTLRVWDADTGKCLQTLIGHQGWVNCVTILQNGNIVSGSNDGTLRVWDINTGTCLKTLAEHSNRINCVASLSCGLLVSGSSDNTLRIWDPAVGKCLHVLMGHTNIVTCVSVISKSQIVSGSRDGTARIWNTITGENTHVLRGHTGSINCISVLPDKMIVSGSDDKTVRIWDSFTGQCLHVFGRTVNRIACIACTTDKRIVSGSADCRLQIWDYTTEKCIRKLEGHSDRVTCMTVLPSGHIVSGARDNSLLVWDETTGKCISKIIGHTDWVRDVSALSENRIVSCSDDGTVRVWDIQTGSCIQQLEGHTDKVSCITVLPNKLIVSGSYDKTVRVWDPVTGKCIHAITGFPDRVRCIAALSNNLVITGSDDNTIRISDISACKCFHPFGECDDWVRCLTVLPDGRIASGSDDSRIRIWDPAYGSCQKVIVGHSDWVTCIAALSDETIVSGSRDGSIRMWNINTGSCVAHFEAIELDVSNMDFSLALLPSDLKRTLKQNGAKVPNI